MRMPRASSRANSSAQPGSSTITGSPGRSSVRLTMSSAWVAPMVVMIWSGAAGTLMPTSFCERLRRRLMSPAGSPYWSDSSCSTAVPVMRRTAVGMKVDDIQSGGNTPMPGCGLSLGRWNMLRISELASAGTREAIICTAMAAGMPLTPGAAAPLAGRPSCTGAESRT
jgi:hypothetical protein